MSLALWLAWGCVGIAFVPCVVNIALATRLQRKIKQVEAAHGRTIAAHEQLTALVAQQEREWDRLGAVAARLRQAWSAVLPDEPFPVERLH